jgi:ribonuclease Z
MPIKLTILGSGSPEAYRRRASSGYLLEIGGDLILFDCGGGVFDNLVRSGRLPRDITHLFFSHYHSDHMMDYARLVHAAWDEGGEPIKVFGPPPLIELTERFFGRRGALAFDLVARTELEQSKQVWVNRGGALPRPWPAPALTEINPGFSCQGNEWRLTTARATHAEPLLNALSFRVEHGGKSFVYSGDTGINPYLAELCKGADFLLHWCYRGSSEPLHPALLATSPDPAQIAKMAQSAGVKRLYLTHFRIHMDTEEIHRRAYADLSEHFSGQSGIVEDLDHYEI